MAGYLCHTEDSRVLYLDTDSDGGLPGERPVPGRIQEDRSSRHGPFALQDPCDPGRIGVPFTIRAYGRSAVGIYPKIYYRGQVRIAGKVHKLARRTRPGSGWPSIPRLPTPVHCERSAHM